MKITINEFDSVHQLTLGRRRCNTSDRKLVALPPVLNLPKLLNSPPKKYKCPAMAVPFARYLARHKDRIFTYEAGDGTKSKHVVVIDDTTGEIMSTIQCPEEHLDHCYLVSTRDGLLMVVKKSASPKYDAPHENCQFLVYKLENYEKEPHWTRLSGIGNEMIFLDMYNGFSLVAGNHDGFKGNCIYFISHLKWNPNDPLAHYVLAGFDMAENRCFEVHKTCSTRVPETMERGSTSDPKRTPGIDYISNMPDPILHRILSLLETHEAVRTCILSKRWTTLWTSLSSLSFNVHHFYRRRPYHGAFGNKWGDPKDYWFKQQLERYMPQFRRNENDQVQVFSQFVSMVLHRREPYDLDRFHLNCRDAASTVKFVEEWIQYALKHNVRELHFSTRSTDYFPTCIFDCSSLEKLYLEIHSDRDIYESEGDEVINLPNLKDLYLIGVFLDAGLSKRLFLGCPALEDLCLVGCLFENCQISSNTLKHLTIIIGTYYTDFEEIENLVVRICAPNLTFLSFDGPPAMFWNIISEGTFSIIQMLLEIDDWTTGSDKDENSWEQFLAISSIKDLEITGQICLGIFWLTGLHSQRPLNKHDCFENDLLGKQIPKFSVFTNLESFSTGGFCLSCHFYLLARLFQHSPNIKKLILRHDGRKCELPLHDGGRSSTRLRNINEASSSNISTSPDRDLCDTLRSVFGSYSDSSSSDDEDANESSKCFAPINCKNLSEIKVKYFSDDGSVQRLLDLLFNSPMEIANIEIISFPY